MDNTIAFVTVCVAAMTLGVSWIQKYYSTKQKNICSAEFAAHRKDTGELKAIAYAAAKQVELDRTNAELKELSTRMESYRIEAAADRGAQEETQKELRATSKGLAELTAQIGKLIVTINLTGSKR